MNAEDAFTSSRKLVEAFSMMKWYSATDVAKMFSVAKATMCGHCEDGTIEAVNIARKTSKRRRWRISEKSIAEFEQSRRNEPATETKAKSASRRTVAKPVKDYFATEVGAK